MSISILPVGEPRQLTPPPPPVQLVRPVAGAVESARSGEATRHDTERREEAAASAEKTKEEAAAGDLRRLQESFSGQGITLKFSRDEETKQMVVALIDQRTGEALRQIPSETSLKLKAEIGRLQGYIIDRKI